MESRSISFLLDACGATLLSGSPEGRVTRVVTDSRQVQPGDLFVAIAGEKFDGHAFIVGAAERGAAAVLAERHRVPASIAFPSSAALLGVESTRLALGRLAGRYRRDFAPRTVVVGGSNGKTTTKELLGAVLGQRFRTLRSEASFNNDIGVPMTLLSLDATHEAAVLEVGTNHPGELAPLLDMVRPDLGVVTSIGREHLEFFGSVEGVVAEEGMVAEKLPAGGRLFLNGDSEWADILARRARCPVVRVGLSDRNDWQARNIRVGEDGVTFQAKAPRAECSGEYRVRLLGRHQASNALLALAVGTELGVAPEQLRSGLLECASPKLRLQLSTAHGVRILDDSYNANADSMTAALETLRDMACSGRRIAVLGDMAELGSHAAEAHREVGRKCAEIGVDRLMTVGWWSATMADAAAAAGLREVQRFPDVNGAAAAIVDFVTAGDLVLLKASRSTGLERVGEALRAGRPASCAESR